MFDAFEKMLQLLGVKDRLRDRKFGARLDLPFKAPDFVIQVDRAGIDAHADDEAVGLPIGLPPGSRP